MLNRSHHPKGSFSLWDQLADQIIDHIFHKEIKDAEEKRSGLWSIFFQDNNANYKNPEEMNEFIKNLMDPFNNSMPQSTNDFDTYYDEYYKLYDIEQPEIIGTPKAGSRSSLSFRLPFLGPT